MTCQAHAFKAFLSAQHGFQKNSCDTYNSFLLRMDRAKGGLDESIKSEGKDAVLAWARSATVPPFDSSRSHANSVLKKYMQFLMDVENPTEEAENEIQTESEQLEPSGLAFNIEREMQQAVRRQLSAIEDGLVEFDGGRERRVVTGFIDIVAKDQSGRVVVIELKAGMCPTGALEQVLGYAEALSQEDGLTDVRTILIASDFPDRLRAASKRVRDIQLLRYDYSLKFSGI